MTNVDVIHTRLAMAVTEYDRKQSTRKGYNSYALAMYLGAVQDACAMIEDGKSADSALRECFDDRLLDICLKVIQ